MKRLKLMSIMTLSLMLSFTACEKEGSDILPNSAQNTNSKSSATPTKSGGGFPSDYWDNLQQFIFDVMEGNDLSNMEVEKALYYTESALDWRLVNEDSSHFTDIIVHEKQYIVGNLSEENEEFYISGTALETLNDDIYSDIFNHANTVADTSEVLVVVHVVDLTWEVDAGGSATVNAKTYYGRQKAITQCINIEDRIARAKADCNYNSTKTTAAEHINDFTWPLLCGTWENKLNCPRSTGMVVNTRSSDEIKETDCGASLYKGFPGTCRTLVDNDGDHGEAQAAWNSECNLIYTAGDKLRHVQFYDGTPHFPFETTFFAKYIKAECVTICVGSLCAPPLNYNPTVFPTFQED